MNKSQLVDALAQRFEGNRRAASEALEAVLDTITREVAKGEKVAITGFGSFERRVRPSRWVRNPRTGERIKAKKTAVPKFNPGADLKAVVSGARKLPALAVTVADSAVDTLENVAKAAGLPTTGRTTTKKSAPAQKTPAKKTTAKKAPAKKTTAKKTTAKSTPAKSTAAKKSSPKKSTTKATPAKTSAAKKSTTKSTAKATPAKSTAAKKTTAKSTPAKKSTAKKSTAKKTAKKSS